MAGREVAHYRDGAGTIPNSSPRPVLHPVRTLGGVVLTAQHPADHDWHNGVGVALQDVNGTNFWGGRTYVSGQGYTPLDDHGEIHGEAPEAGSDGFRQRLAWVGRGGAVELHEDRAVAWAPLDEGLWRLSFRTSLHSERGATLGSPGSKGRVGGGYGGFFWRFPACEAVEVFTAAASGETAVHGSVAPWVAWSADFLAGPGISGPATVVIASPDAAAHGEPWFVRVQDYPGLGSSLAWDRAVDLAPGQVLARHFEVAVADGRLGAERRGRTGGAPDGGASMSESASISPGAAGVDAAGEHEAKRARVLDILDQAGVDAVLLTGSTTLGWYLGGARSHVSLAADPILCVRVGRDGRRGVRHRQRDRPPGRGGTARRAART